MVGLTTLALAIVFISPNVLSANTTTVDLDIGWLRASPDGYEREVIGVNGRWPPPVLYFSKGDQIVVNVMNNLKNESTAVHFHGMFQNGTTHMDGAAGVTQCAIPPGSKFTYNFTVSAMSLRVAVPFSLSAFCPRDRDFGLKSSLFSSHLVSYL